MKRETITISVKPDMKKYILRRGSTDYESVSHYIRSLVLRDDYHRREMAKLYDRERGNRTPRPR